MTFNINGYVADTLYTKGCVFISRRVSARHCAAASITNTIRYSYRKYSSAHVQLYALASNLQPRSYSGYFFDSYGLPPLIPSILNFLRRMCSHWEYNTTQLLGLTSTICGEYFCLFALYMYRGYSPNSLWASSMQPSPTGRSAVYSHQTSDRYVRRAAAVRGAHLLRL